MNSKRLLFGTIDSFLIWRLTKGKVHATDATNASRTMIFNITSNKWDDTILRLLKIKDLKDLQDFGVPEGTFWKNSEVRLSRRSEPGYSRHVDRTSDQPGSTIAGRGPCCNCNCTAPRE